MRGALPIAKTGWNPVDLDSGRIEEVFPASVR